jgi:DNA polymerase III delta prime subunit
LSKLVDGTLKVPLLLVGPDGVGKRYSASQAVREALVRGYSTPLRGALFDRGEHPDYTFCAPGPDKDLGVDDVRALVAKAWDSPALSRKRYIVIDGGDRLTSAAANALLKTLEEPPATTQFIILAESSRRVLSTIRSRCSTVQYRRLNLIWIEEFLADEDKGKSALAARLSEGSVGRALYYLSSGRLSVRDSALEALKTGVSGDLSRLFHHVDENKKDLSLLVHFMHLAVYDLLMLLHSPSTLINQDRASDLVSLYQQLGSQRVVQLHQELSRIEDSDSEKINRDFQLKSALASVFS